MSAEARSPGSSMPWFLLAMLSISYSLAVIDRFLLSLLVAPIQHDLRIGDAAFGLLHGLAFVILYALVGIPIGRLVDRTRRVSLVAGGMGFWSLMTIGCGLARNFGQMFGARVGVGVGEAVLSPAGYSLISDSFPSHRLALANGIFYLGAVLGGGLAFILGGYTLAFAERNGTVIVPLLGSLAPWQQVFLIFGAPGLVMAAVFAFLSEPRRRSANREAVLNAHETVGLLRKEATWLVPLLLGIGSLSMAMAGVPAWIIALLGREFGLPPKDAGVLAGLVAIGSATVGLIGGGLVGDRFGVGRPHRRLVLAAAGAAGCGLAAACIALTATIGSVLTSYGLLMMVSAPSTALAMASLQERTPGHTHGFVAALFMVAVNLIGAALGPALVGVASAAAGGNIAFGMVCVAMPAGLVGALLLLVSAYAQRRKSASKRTADDRLSPGELPGHR